MISPDASLVLFQNASIAVYRYIVSESQSKKIRSIVGQFEVESHLYTYNLLGLLGVMLSIPIKRKNLVRSDSIKLMTGS